MGRFRFGPASLKQVETCHPLLQEVLHEAILRSPMDFCVTEGFRGKIAQDHAVRMGLSKTPWPTSKHNHMENGQPCSLAADLAPWYAEAPHIRWKETEEFRFLGGFVCGIGARIVEPRGYRLRWGGDFDGDGDHAEPGVFEDLPHLELVPL